MQANESAIETAVCILDQASITMSVTNQAICPQALLGMKNCTVQSSKIAAALRDRCASITRGADDFAELSNYAVQNHTLTAVLIKCTHAIEQTQRANKNVKHTSVFRTHAKCRA